MKVHRGSHHPLPSSPIKGEVSGRCIWRDFVPNAMQHLPLDGGGWEGVTAGWDAASPSRLADGGARTVTCSPAEERIPLTLTFLLNAKLSVPLPQGARGGWSR